PLVRNRLDAYPLIAVDRSVSARRSTATAAAPRRSQFRRATLEAWTERIRRRNDRLTAQNNSFELRSRRRSDLFCHRLDPRLVIESTTILAHSEDVLHE